MRSLGMVWLVTLSLGAVGCFDHHPLSESRRGDASLDARRDASPDVAPGDASPDVAPGDAPVSCAAQDVAESPCIDCADFAFSYFWDGHECRTMSGCACVGEDCEALYTSPAECRRAHAICAPEVCRRTDGQWIREPRYCDAPECGNDVRDCEAPVSVCHCGRDQVFDPERGCEFRPECTMGIGDEQLCLVSLGRWEAICCPTVCGARCPDDCADMACNCGPSATWDPRFGCLLDEACLAPAAIGEACEPSRREPCERAGHCCSGVCAPPSCEGPPPSCGA